MNGKCVSRISNPPVAQRSCCFVKPSMVSGASPTARVIGMKTDFHPRSCSIRLVQTSSDFESVCMPPMSSIALRRKMTFVPTQNAALKRFRRAG